MLDIAFIRENKEVVQKACSDKGVSVDVDKFLGLDDKRRLLHQKIDELRAERNMLSGGAKKGKPEPAAIERSKAIGSELAKLEPELDKVEKSFVELWRLIPNIPSPESPVGPDETANTVTRTWGEKPKFGFEPKPNWELGRSLDVIDMERATRMSGARFAYLKGNLVKLQFAIITWLLSELTDSAKIAEIAKKAGLNVSDTAFLPVIPPDMIMPEVFARTGRLNPAEDKYLLEKDQLYLAGSAEQTLLPLHMDEVLSEAELPIRYLGYSTAFRREAGSYGQDTRGLLRLHQFDKLEMQVITTPAQSASEFELLVAIQEHILQALELPYQVVEISTGDMGKPDYRQVDMETWMPGQDAYRETHTADNNTDYQARGLNVRYLDEQGNKQYVHMHDGTAVAFSRIPIAIMENYQQADGTIAIPKVLQGYMGSTTL